MREQLIDIIKHTHDLKILEHVLVTSSDEETMVQSIDSGQAIIVHGIMKTPMDNINGKFGLGNLDTLKGYCNFPMFMSDDAKISVKHKRLAGETFPEEFIFTGDSSKAIYRCMLESAIPNQATPRSYDWDVDIVIPKGKLIEFSKMSSILKEEKYVHIELIDGDLNFHIGSPDSTENHAVITMQENVDGELDSIFMWNIQNFISVAKLSDGDISFRMLARGMININVSSEYCDYQYYLPRVILEDTVD